MLIILDIGANDGCSILKFQDILKKKGVTEYKIYSFEPILFFSQYLDKLKGDKVEIIYKAASVNDKDIDLYLSTKTSDGSSIYSDKLTNGINNKKFITVKSIDIVNFINRLPDYDELWIKLDIEGAEYDLIPYLHKNKCLKLFKKLFIEWHAHKITSISDEQHKKCYELVKHLDPIDWDALDFSSDRKKDKKYRSYIKKILNRS